MVATTDFLGELYFVRVLYARLFRMGAQKNCCLSKDYIQLVVTNICIKEHVGFSYGLVHVHHRETEFGYPCFSICILVSALQGSS
jgi:hypothetical protein